MTGKNLFRAADMRCCGAQYLVMSPAARCLETLDVCISIRRMFACISVVVTLRGSVGMFVVYCELWKVVFFSRDGRVGFVVHVCRG